MEVHVIQSKNLHIWDVLVLLGLVGCPAALGGLSGELRVTATWVTVPRQLSPRADTNPLAVSYRLEVERRPRVLRLWPRRGLVSHPFTLVTYGKDGARWQEHPIVQDNCFYQGEVQGSPGSLVALSTCGRGLRGVLWVEGRTYEIEPVPNDPAYRHILSHMEAASDPAVPTCGLTPEELQHQKAVLPWFKAHHRAEEEELKEWWTHTRYVKMVVVVDNVRFVKSGRNESEVLRQVIEIINIGDSLYEQLSVRLFLVGLEIWTKGNLINITNSINKVLDSFNKWRRSDLSLRIRHDVAQLLAFQNFGRSLGLAFLGSICDNQWSSAVASFTNRKLSSVITTFVHELGHVLGMDHDEPGCKCRRKKCIMWETDVDTDAFSDCSYKDYFDLLAHGANCLRRPPAPGTFYTTRREYCGNKIVERGEQCDCGSESDCRKDRCCHPDCTLTADSVCASGKCCKRCQVLQAGTLCRASTDECDLPEYCNGTSPQCPADVYIQDGAPCKGDAYCYRGKCSSLSKQCKKLFGKQAKAAPLDCFKAVNTRGDRFGNCGIRDNIHFTKCNIENVLCGRIQCVNIHKLPFLQNHVTLVQTPVGNKKCWGLDYHVGMPVADVGAVEDGTPCGSGRLCINRTCTNISVLNYDCSVTKCHGRGVCNNLKNCHCRYGWAPPYCEWAGFGGSVDSGPAPARNTFHRGKAIVALLSILYLCIFGITLTICYKREIVEWLRRKRPSTTEDSSCFKCWKCQQFLK
ncbi:PREDICTED: LOW QUALITY PROTEIN: disintegrin and metalloproteinase domain-containing protein 21-like [Mesitornis unicolor]|uniref:LOW QUALITY PROTEIN: disintegrin and metalloproteinase domain-containing protein 21-like n=1 Tax=Mesitornis unicolor TaxID=54374 RepID=UPI0005295863|nr:PREDICTED: LOW QUALITY PROTEIN: disintegrin and metalloproteinase domain-containing protein 21-like [Mesitornis unicolor]